MAKNSNKVVVGGKAVDLDKLDEVTAIQAQLLPPNWPVAKRDGVRLFLSLQEMAALEFKRHLAHNFKQILKTAFEQQADGEGARVPVSFSIELDFTAPNVAAFAKTKMSFSHKFSTEGKPKTHDIAQGDFYGDLSSTLDGSLAAEQLPDPEPKAPSETEEKPKKRKKKGKDAAANDDSE